MFKSADISISYQVETFQLAYQWKISRNTSSEKTNLIVCLKYKECEIYSEAAPNIRYNESIQSLIEGFEYFNGYLSSINEFSSKDISEGILNGNYNASLKFALNSCFESLNAKLLGISLNKSLKIPEPKTVPMMYSIPIMEVKLLQSFYDDHELSQYKILKLKINQEIGIVLTNELLRLYPHQIIIDANESFETAQEVVNFLESIDSKRVLFLEQPIHQKNILEIERFKILSSFPVFADESLQINPDWDFISKNFNGVNIKLMKAGSLENAISQINKAQELGLNTMIGCMVESSIGIHYAYQLAHLFDYVDLDGFLTIKNEPFQLLTISNGMLISIAEME